jgi:hypothetical protein
MFSDDWFQILNEVSEFQDGKQTTWFRGQKDSEFRLVSGLYRKNLKNPISYIATENTYYSYFKRMGYVHHNEDDWNLLFLMQHHGVKTRLLDWTESFSVALFFAYEGWDFEKDCSVWILDPLGLNEKTLGERKYYVPEEKYENLINLNNPGFYDNSVALYPIRNSSRILSQQGVFTLQGKAGIPLEEEHNGELIEEGILKKIVIKPDLKEDVEKYLKVTGVNSFTLFPDLDGLAKYINNLGYFKPRN